MRKKICSVLFVVFCTGAAFAQHSATLNYQASATSGVQYNVWRAPCSNTPVNGACTEGTFGLITGSPISALTFTDNTVAGGSSYSYYVTAICPAAGCQTGITPGSSSPPSNHIAVAIPGAAPSPNPTGPTVVTIIVQ